MCNIRSPCTCNGRAFQASTGTTGKDLEGKVKIIDIFWSDTGSDILGKSLKKLAGT